MLPKEVKRENLPLSRAITFILLFSLSSMAAEKFRLTAISFDKLERLSRSEVLIRMKLQVGGSYTPEELKAQLERDIERLYRTGEFKSVGPAGDCVIEDFSGGKRVIIPVEEKKRVSAVYLQGGGAVGRKDLTEDLRTATGRLLSPGDLAKDVATLEETCLSEGYFFAHVSVEKEPLPGCKTKVTFVVSPGPHVRIYDIRFAGNRTVPDGELLAQMETKPRDFWFLGLLREGYLSMEKLISDVNQLRAYLRGAKGLLDATVGVEDLTFGPKRHSLVITIRVEEGRPYILKDFDLKVQSPPDEEPCFPPAEVLSKVNAEKLIGKPYSARDLELLSRKIRSLYQEQGYLNCRVNLEEPGLSLKGNEATAVLNIQEKNPVYARHIRVRGNRETKDEVVRRELTFGPGDLVTLSDLRESISNLHELRFFKPESVDIQPLVETATAEGTDFHVDVEEGREGQLILGIGLESEMGIIGSFAVRKRNFDITDWPDSIGDIPSSFKGAGQSLSLRLEPGTRYSHYRLSFKEPYLLGRWYGLSVTGWRSISARDTWRNKSWGAGVKLYRYLTFERDIFASLGYEYKFNDIGSVEEGAPDDAHEAEGSARLSTLSLGFNVNKYLYDPYAGPYQGYRLWAKYHYCGGFLDADIDYSSAQAGAAYFLEVYETGSGLKHVLSVTGSFGWMEPHHNTDEVPIYERFFLGGPRNLRGFRPYGVGPHEEGEEIGGSAMVYGTVEYSLPLFIKYLRGVFFFDWGQLEGPYMEGGVQKWSFDRLSMDRMRTAAGAGIRISLTPMGLPVPISLYWGEAIDKEPEDRPRHFLFTIGHIAF